VALHIPGLPPLSWAPLEGDARLDDDGTLVLTAAAGVDWSNDPTGGPQQHRAAALGFQPTGDLTLSARVRVDAPRSTFDAGALCLWIDADHWAKLCFERSPQGDVMVVSVVTDGYSDDCNSVLVTGGEVYLRLSRVGEAWAFHSSVDGTRWDFVRVFRIGSTQVPTVGFLSQAPMGERCVARFDDIVYREDRLADLRDGS
jgi:regulation of enolase protein 1 (concanavalin A-like superfamily)